MRLVEALIGRKADIGGKDSLGNTPLLKAAGQGLATVCEFLIASRADVTATDDRGAGAAQKAQTFSSLKRKLVDVFKCPMTHVDPREKQRREGGDSASRTVRREFGQAHAATNKPIGKGGTGDVVQNLYGCWRENERLTAKGAQRWHWEDRRGSSEDLSGSWKTWDEHHHYGHASKGSSSWSWNQNGGDWRSW